MGEIVKAVGGVDFDVPRNMNYDDDYQNLHIHLNKGMQRLNAEQAMAMLRYRNDDQGDDLLAVGEEVVAAPVRAHVDVGQGAGLHGLQVHAQGLVQRLNAEQAMAMLRYRNDNGYKAGYNDIGRMNTQRDFLKAMAKGGCSSCSPGCWARRRTPGSGCPCCRRRRCPGR